MKKLTPEEIREQLKKERNQKAHSYKDGVDLTIDRAVDLYEQKRIDEATLKTFVSLILTSAMNDTVSGLQNDLMKRNFFNFQNSEPNKLLLVNYSKKSYA